MFANRFVWGGRRGCVGVGISRQVCLFVVVSAELSVTATWDRTAVAEFTARSGHMIGRNEKDHEK